jgi:hypothetical protein
MGQKYKVSFTDDRERTICTYGKFWCAYSNLNQIIKMKSAERNKAGIQPGIPIRFN